MPSGVLLVAERVVTLAGRIEPNPARILDIGAGYGKYAVLLREYLDPTPTIHGVEAWEGYVEPHRLRGIYDHLYVRDALTFTAEEFAQYDLVVLGDVIEHFEKEDGLTLLSRAASCWVVLATPVVHFHTDPTLPPTERHLSHWVKADFANTGRLDHYEESYGAIVARLRPVAS